MKKKFSLFWVRNGKNGDFEAKKVCSEKNLQNFRYNRRLLLRQQSLFVI